LTLGVSIGPSSLDRVIEVACTCKSELLFRALENCVVNVTTHYFSTSGTTLVPNLALFHVKIPHVPSLFSLSQLADTSRALALVPGRISQIESYTFENAQVENEEGRSGGIEKHKKGADGVIIGHSWNVRWSAGPHAGEVTKRSSVSLMFWNALVAGATDTVASAALKPMLGKLVQSVMLAAIVGGLFTLTRSEQSHASPPVVSLLLVPAYALIADAVGAAARAKAGAGVPASANPDVAALVATRFAAAFWLASALATAAGGAALVLVSDPPSQPGGAGDGSAVSARGARPPRVRLFRLADYSSLAVLAGGTSAARGWRSGGWRGRSRSSCPPVTPPRRWRRRSRARSRSWRSRCRCTALYGSARAGAVPTRGALRCCSPRPGPSTPAGPGRDTARRARRPRRGGYTMVD